MLSLLLKKFSSFVSRKYRRRQTADSNQSFDSAAYWEQRYAAGGNSGAGSYNNLAEFKARVVNELVRELSVTSVIEFGCGDGNQLSLMDYPSYLGIDTSAIAVAKCQALFAADPTRSFVARGDYSSQKADMALSLDVIFHLIEDAIFEEYMETLFASAAHQVLIYSSNTNLDGANRHVRHRRFSDWIEVHRPEWELLRRIPNQYPARPGEETQSTSFCDFYLYQCVQALRN